MSGIIYDTEYSGAFYLQYGEAEVSGSIPSLGTFFSELKESRIYISCLLAVFTKYKVSNLSLAITFVL